MGLGIRVFGCLLVLMLSGLGSYGQTFSEFFRQKKTQEEYLVKQIGFLELYGGYVRQGYEIVGSGLKVIRDFTSGEFDLHKNFFASLKAVNPLIKNDTRVLEIVLMQDKIAAVFREMSRLELSKENMSFVLLVKNGVLEECEKDVEELELLMSASALQMSDDQRLSKLDGLHRSMLEKFASSHGFYLELKSLVGLKNEHKLGLDWLRRWHEIN